MLATFLPEHAHDAGGKSRRLRSVPRRTNGWIAIMGGEITDMADADNEYEGEWTDDGRLLLKPSYSADQERVFCALLLVGGTDMTEADVAGWTAEQCHEAATWALSVSFAASDNEGIFVPPRPAFIPCIRGRDEL